MGVNDVPFLMLPRQAKGTVQPRDGIFFVNRQVDDPDFRMQLGFHFSPRCCQKDLMPVGYLYLRKFDHITFYAALFKFRDDVKDSHFSFSPLRVSSGSVSIPQLSLPR